MELKTKTLFSDVLIKWIDNLEEIEKIEECWVSLEKSAKNRTVHSKFDWVIPWYRHYCGIGYQQYGKPLVGTAWIGEKLVGVAPFTIWKGTLGKIPVNRIDFAGFNSQAGEFLFEDGKYSIIYSILKNLFDSKRFDVLCLNNIKEDSEEYRIICHVINDIELRAELSKYRFAMVDLTNGYDNYYKSMGRNFRRNIKRHEKKIYSAGRPKIEELLRIDNKEDLSEALDRINKISDLSWKNDKKQKSSDHHKSFYEEVALRFGKHGSLHLSILSIDSTDVAYVLSILDRGVYYDVTISFNDMFKEYSPGTYLMQEILRGLPNVGVHTVISHGDHEYKRRWTSQFESRCKVFIFSPSIRALLSRALKFRLPIIYKTVRKSILI